MPSMTLLSASRRSVLKGCLCCASAGLVASTYSTSAETVTPPAVPYLDPTIMSKLPFGMHSHYLQPWRSYLDTVSAADFLRGIGVVLDDGPMTSDATIEMLARGGITNVRLEISWSELDFDDERRLNGDKPFRRVLAACRRWHLRPLILLNAHHGRPVPTRNFIRTILENAPAGAKSIELGSTDGIVIGRTGLSNLSEFWAAESLVTSVSGKSLTLSKPLVTPLRAGDSVELATLAYEPFGTLDMPGTDRTLAGWVQYVDTIARFVADALGTASADDKGFDLEIWNELSFGTKFLSINNYYSRPTGPDRYDAIWAAIVTRTADWVTAHPDRFAGVRLTNGFASTIPWPASSTQPRAVTALSKHPYPRQLVFPADDQRSSRCVDAVGAPTSFVPSYEAYFPEYFATAIQTETVVRDMGPAESEIYGTKHGRLSRRSVDGTGPVPVWITEIGVNPKEVGVTDRAAAQMLKAKAVGRFLLFYLNKGAERVYLYSASGSEMEYGIVAGTLSDDATMPGAARKPPLSPCLQMIERIVGVMRQGSSADPGPLCPLRFAIHVDTSAAQFAGDGTDQNPSFRNVDSLALLPYQCDAYTFVVAHYFVTRDARKGAAAEDVTLDILGLDGSRTALRVYDPLTDAWSNVRRHRAEPDRITMTLNVTDSPRLLVARRSPTDHKAGPAQ